MPRICAQMIVSVDENGVFRAELARPGSPLRTKIELRDGVEWTTIRAEMLTMSALNRANHEECERIAAANRRQSIENRRQRLAREIYTDVAKHHSVKLANRVVPGMKAKIKHVAEGGYEIQVGSLRVGTTKVTGRDRYATVKAAAESARVMGLTVANGTSSRKSREPGVAVNVSADEI